MIDRTIRALGMGLLGLAMCSLVGCSDTEEDASCETSADCPLGAVCSADGACTFNFTDCAKDDECESSQICEANVCVVGCRADASCGAQQVCVSNTCKTVECDGNDQCGVSQRCVGGLCVGVSQCTAVGQICEPTATTNAGFTCVDQGTGSTVCALVCEEQKSCIYPSGDLTTRGVCPQGSICQTGACLPSNCDPSKVNADCEALSAINPAAVPVGSTCQKSIIQLSSDGDGFKTDDDQNYAYRCVAPGNAAVGAACGNTGGLGGVTNCQAGLKCISDEYTNGIFTQGTSVCQKPCKDDGQCGEGETCIGDEDNRFDGAGICAVACKPFDVDPNACPGGTCLPMGNNEGRCVNTGTTGAALPYADCGTGTDACPSGTICVASQCVPICDPSLKNQPERDATCFTGDPTTYARFIHLASDAGAVDIYVDGKKVVEDLAFEDVTEGDNGWFALTPGAHTVDVVSGTAQNNQRPLVSVATTLEQNTGTNFFALPGTSAAAPVRVIGVAETRFVAAPAANRAQLSVVHAVVGADPVDVIATAPDADVTLMASRTVLAGGLAYGSASAYAPRTSGTFDIYVFPAGGPYTQVAALSVFQDFVISAGQKSSLVAYGAPDDGVAPALELVAQQPFKHIPTSGAYCYDLAGPNGAVTRPGWGICLQKCEAGAADYGTGACDAASAGCSPFGDNISVCLGEAGSLQVGAACNGSVDCEDGLFCDQDSTGNGVCRSYCTLDGLQNSSLPGCQAGETCQPSELIPNLGECRMACQPAAPGDFKDTTRCPANQQTCYPEDGNFFCRASGALAVGTSCGVNGDLADTCAPGSLCVRNHSNIQSGLEQLIEAFVNYDASEQAFCRKVCRPFKAAGEASDCSADEACMPVLPSQDLNTAAGICFPKAAGIDATFDVCDGADAGKMCRDGSVCQRSLDEPAEGNMCVETGSCLQFCDYATQRGCLTGQRCVVNGGVGNRQLIFGVYGICQDET